MFPALCVIKASLAAPSQSLFIRSVCTVLVKRFLACGALAVFALPFSKIAHTFRLLPPRFLLAPVFTRNARGEESSRVESRRAEPSHESNVATSESQSAAPRAELCITHSRIVGVEQSESDGGYIIGARVHIIEKEKPTVSAPSGIVSRIHFRSDPIRSSLSTQLLL